MSALQKIWESILCWILIQFVAFQNELPEFYCEKNPWMANQDCTPEHLEGSRKYDLICLSDYRASAWTEPISYHYSLDGNLTTYTSEKSSIIYEKKFQILRMLLYPLKEVCQLQFVRH